MNGRKILIIPDVRGWAFDHNFRAIAVALKRKYPGLRVDFKYTKEHSGRGYDAKVFSYWRQRFAPQRTPRAVWATGVSSWRWEDANYTSQEPPSARALRSAAMYRIFYASSKSLYKHFAHLPNVTYAPFGVEPDFYPVAKLRNTSKDLVVGWAGHPGRIKRLNRIKKAVDMVDGVRLVTREYKTGSYTSKRCEMRNFYAGLDAYIICSAAEGEPKTAKEAACCGTPLISTEVGCVPELLIPRHTGWYFDGSVNGLVETLKHVRDNRDQLQAMRGPIRELSRQFHMEAVLPAWERYFTIAMKG